MFYKTYKINFIVIFVIHLYNFISLTFIYKYDKIFILKV